MFHPNMHAITQGFAVSGPLRHRSWQGLLADVWQVEGRKGAQGEYLSAFPRLFVVLDASATGAIRIAATQDRWPAGSGGPNRLSFIPAGLRTWSHLPQAAHLRHLDLHFDVPALLARFDGALDEQRLATPRLMFDNDRVLTLARLLADECTTPALHDLYGDSLALALFVDLFEVPRAPEHRHGQLSARRLRHATEFIEANCLRTIRLQELADLAGLSQSYFSAAFKASTGLAPHQWQTRIRVERVKTLLLVPGTTLTGVAAAAGFADQAHLTRVFKQWAGLTPAAWRRAHAGRM